MKKNKLIVSILTAAALLTSMVTTAAITSHADIVPGDVDQNGVLDSNDALLIMRSSVGLAALSDDQLAVADVNGDGVVDVSDALSTLQSAIGIVSKKVEPKSNKAGWLTDDEAEVVRLVNVERSKQGLPALEPDKTLSEVADRRMLELPIQCDHTRPNGTKWSTVLEEMDYHYLSAGENIAGGIVTPAEVVAAWMDSPGHRANILCPDYNKIGVSYAFFEDSEYHHYWNQIFAGISVDIPDEKVAEETLLAQINNARRKNGLPELSFDEKLSKIAEIRADDITVDMSNTRPNGSDWKTLVDDYKVDYYTLSQIYCAGQHDEFEVFDYYMNGSTTPKFLDPDREFHKVGIGHAFVDNDEYSHYWVLIFTDQT